MAQGVAADADLAIEPGALKYQIAINQQSSAQDTFGQPVPTWNAIRTCWAGINLVGMREVFSNDQLTSQSTDIWTMRWSPIEIQPGMQLVFGASTYRIQAVSNIGKRKRLLHLLCLELNAQS